MSANAWIGFVLGVLSTFGMFVIGVPEGAPAFAAAVLVIAALGQKE